jgi:cytidine deaminase
LSRAEPEGSAPPFDADKLVAVARAFVEHAHAPYSRLTVGAALLAGGRIFGGVNIENASFSATLCAERVAAAQAIAAGVQDLVAIAVVTSAVKPVPPCGVCRQFLIEFNPELAVVSEGDGGERRMWRLRDLLPDSFGREHVGPTR